MDKFAGFSRPSQNYSKLPHDFVDCLPMIDSMAELKVVIYILRHTWGYSEFGKAKKITADEFMHGRQRKDGTRIDNGTGLSKPSVISGLESAVAHGFILVEVDNSDMARVEKFYCLNMSGVKDFYPEVKNVDPRGKNLLHRSEKETLERNLEKEIDSDGEIFKALENLTGALNTKTPRFVDTWKEKHPPARILEAIALAKTKGRKPVEYVDSILIGWEANGYPKTREEMINERKNTGVKHATNQPSYQTDPEQDRRDRETAERIKARRVAANL